MTVKYIAYKCKIKFGITKANTLKAEELKYESRERLKTNVVYKSRAYA